MQTLIQLARSGRMAQRRVERRKAAYEEAIAERDRILLDLHRAGWGYRRISAQLDGGLDPSGVRQGIDRARRGESIAS